MLRKMFYFFTLCFLSLIQSISYGFNLEYAHLDCSPTLTDSSIKQKITPKLKLAEHLEVTEETISELLRIIELEALALPPNDGFVVYGSRTTKFWRGRGDIDMKMLMPQEGVSLPRPYQKEKGDELLELFRKEYGVPIDTSLFHYWGDAPLLDLIEAGLIADKAKETLFLEKLCRYYGAFHELRILEQELPWDHAKNGTFDVWYRRKNQIRQSQMLDGNPFVEFDSKLDIDFKVVKHPLTLKASEALKERSQLRPAYWRLGEMTGLKQVNRAIPLHTTDTVFLLKKNEQASLIARKLMAMGFEHVYYLVESQP